jgi:hypothetical protein
MERVFLKKQQFLEGAQPGRPETPLPEPAAKPGNGLSGKRPGDTGGRRQPQGSSLFGDKLLGALGEDR